MFYKGHLKLVFDFYSIRINLDYSLCLSYDNRKFTYDLED